MAKMKMTERESRIYRNALIKGYKKGYENGKDDGLLNGWELGWNLRKPKDNDTEWSKASAYHHNSEKRPTKKEKKMQEEMDKKYGKFK